MQSKPESIDDYLARVPADRRGALEQLRRAIHGILPNVEECISYSMPAFRHEGRVVAGFLATASGCSYYPFSGTTLGTLAAELRAYSQTKSAVHFDPRAPLPKSLVRRLLAVRIAEGTGKPAKVKKRTRVTRSPKAPRSASTGRAAKAAARPMKKTRRRPA